MSINFSTLKKLTIPEGVVKQITDASGRVLWSASKPIVLTVEKITNNTYAGETLYENEQFILLDIYPKTNGTVKVTYGGLTKTITDTSGAEAPNAQKVYFGTFNGVSDSVATPSGGTLTIEGDYENFACGGYASSSKTYSLNYCGCITGVQEWGDITNINYGAFRSCTKLSLSSIPSHINNIGDYAFYECSNLALTSLPSSLTSINTYTFYKCSNLALSSIPSGITSIGSYAFYRCESLQYNDNFFSEGLESIDEAAFYYANDGYSFKHDITIPETVTSIGKNAFAGYSEKSGDYTYFKRVMVLPKTPPTAPELFFGEYAQGFGFKIVVPKGCVEIYKATNGWKNYSSVIEEAS